LTSRLSTARTLRSVSSFLWSKGEERCYFDRRMAKRNTGSSTFGLQRRDLLGVAAGLSFGCTPRGEPPRSDDASKPSAPAASSPEASASEHFVVHGERPLTKETLRGEQGASVVTPSERFFVRNNLPMPHRSFVEYRGRWALELKGTQEERTLTLDELKTLGMESIATVLQCSGNGRKFFEHGPSGSPWGVGAAGCAIWVGLPVRLLAKALGGVIDGVRFLTSTGGEVLPPGVERDQVVVERSIPVDKALDDCLLAWEMNGEPLPLEHGGPLRLVVPGYFGCNNIKYVKRLAFTERQTQAKIQRSGYRLRPIGEKGAEGQPSMWEMNVKSWINGPGADGVVPPGRTSFHGVAFSGGHPITRVECSVDDGESWQEARLIGPDLGPYAWRQFTFQTELRDGVHRIFSRAVDATGATQPERRVENERGYGNNSWRDHGLEVTVSARAPTSVSEPATAPAMGVSEKKVEPAPPPSSTLDAQARRGRQAILDEAQPACGACHALDEAGLQGAVGPELDALAPAAARVEAAVTNGVGAMPAYKDRLSEQTIKDIAHYVEAATRSPK